jgi:tetratricopeptide (TPR) repeat protein
VSKPSRGRIWLFRLTASILVPAAILGLTELGLRLFGYGFDPSPMLARKLDGRPAVVDNYRFPWRFFPREISRDFDPFIFSHPKPADVFRVFIVGGSAAQGVPDGAFSFSRILSAMLEEAYPSQKFEVINAALTAVNSHAALLLAREIARRQADAVIIYMGNNEVVGPYGPGTVFSPFLSSLKLIRFNIALKTFRLGQLLNGLLRAAGRGGDSRVWRGMEMFLDKQVRAGDARLAAVYGHFRENLEDICGVLVRGGSRVILCTVAVNLADCPPFASLHGAAAPAGRLGEWEDLFGRGAERERSADWAAALDLYRKAAEIDDGHAELHFRMGRCESRLGDHERSRRSYARALELDTLRFRADAGINGLLRETAAALEGRGVFLADVEEAFRAASEHGIPGRELFLDHVHMTFRGNHLIAGNLFERVKLLLPAGVSAADGAEAEPAGLEACAERLAFTAWDRQMILDEMLNAYFRTPPFTNQLDNADEVARMESELAALRAGLTPGVFMESAARYERAVARSPRDWRLRWKYAQLLYLGLDKPREALAQYEAMTEIVPHSYLGWSGMGFIQHKLGDAEAAIASCRQALEAAPTKAEVHNTLAAAYSLRGSDDEAEKHFREAIALQPHYAAPYENLSYLFAKAGRHEDAVRTCRRGLSFEPGSIPLVLALADHLARSGGREEAIAELKKARLKNPRDEELNKKLNGLLWEKAIRNNP